MVYMRCMVGDVFVLGGVCRGSAAVVVAKDVGCEAQKKSLALAFLGGWSVFLSSFLRHRHRHMNS